MKNIIMDCDGVLYPLSELPTLRIISAAKETYREDLGITGEEQAGISEQTIHDGRLGLFNYIKALCEYKNFNFNKFCDNMAERIDYGNIRPNMSLWKKLQSLSNQYNLAILSNNSRPHIEKVTQRLFSKSISEMEDAGIKIFDITSLKGFDGWFRPKREPCSLNIFLKNNGYNPSESILFDDTMQNITAAHRAGMRATLITENNTLENNLQSFIRMPYVRGNTHE